jgi:hypothetical protein
MAWTSFSVTRYRLSAAGSFLSIAWDWGFLFDAALCIPKLQY